MRRLLSALTLTLTAAVLVPTGASAVGSAHVPPAAGGWSFKDPFGDSEGTLTVAAGKTPKVKKLTIEVTQQDNGYMCPPPGTVLKVKGTFTLRKAPKWHGSPYSSPWISAPKDKPYDDSGSNLLGMAPTEVTITGAGDPRGGFVAMSFVKDRGNKPHELEIAVQLLPPGIADDSEGYCLFSADRGKPGK